MVGVSDLMQPLEKLLTREKGMSNLSKFLQPPSGASWKSAVPVEWLCKHQDLFMDYINVAKNSVVSGKKHKTALEKLDDQYQIIQGRKSREDGIDYLDDVLRMGLAHLRQLRQSAEKKQTAYRRCSPDMQEKLDKMLDKIDIGKENCTDMVVFTGDSQDQEQARQPLSKGQGSSDNLESEVKREMDMPQHVTLKIFGEKPESVFDRVLNKKSSPQGDHRGLDIFRENDAKEAEGKEGREGRKSRRPLCLQPGDGARR